VKPSTVTFSLYYTFVLDMRVSTRVLLYLGGVIFTYSGFISTKEKREGGREGARR